MRTKKVEEIMTKSVVRLSPTDSIHEAAIRLATDGISGAPVVSDGKVVGIVSEADLVAAAIPPAKVAHGTRSAMGLLGLVIRGQVTGPVADVSVRSVMSEYVVTVAPSATIWDAAALMERHGVKRLPVIDKERNLVGILSRADLVAVMARSDDDLRIDVIESISVLGDETIEGVRVQVENGVAILRGRADRKTTRDLAVKLAANVPGIVEVLDRLEFAWDDTKSLPGPKDPWAVGPLVKGA